MTNSESLPASGSRRILRRIGAVLGGLVVVVVLDTGIDVLMHASGIYPPWFQPMKTSLWLLATSYRIIDGTMVAMWPRGSRRIGHWPMRWRWESPDSF